MGHDEIGDADDPDFVEPTDANKVLKQLGFPPLPPIATMKLNHQVAQKLHGASEPGSMRAHDLIDLQVIVTRGDLDWALTRETCERLFSYRKRQEWPPIIIKHEGWDGLYAAQLLEEPILQNVDEAVDWANELVEKIQSS